ncbi:hypothetical protein EW146_g6272 [Bondarzewia mesenterica]|uniref:Uncharacterized protein n=1 Tax=Bondarzewia mesenterica TaxID=1095465 RepID=A0A4V3XEK7_9AGAM|nr:hypothetical protein EW146_g6272 [Bondarzewia mesenterica]
MSYSDGSSTRADSGIFLSRQHVHENRSADDLWSFFPQWALPETQTDDAAAASQNANLRDAQDQVFEPIHIPPRPHAIIYSSGCNGGDAQDLTPSDHPTLQFKSVTVVYQPITTRSRTLYLGGLSEPIRFVHKESGNVGIVIQDILSRKPETFIRDWQRVVKNFEQSKLTLRLNWEGCEPWNCQFWAKTYGKHPKPITVGKLARRIAIAVQRFQRNVKILSDSNRPQGAVNPTIVALDRIVLLGFLHVSKGSWQPDLVILV